jgi:hypothetical protein
MSDDSGDDESVEPDESEMQETAVGVEATKKPTREEAVAEAAKKTKGKPQ